MNASTLTRAELIKAHTPMATPKPVTPEPGFPRYLPVAEVIIERRSPTRRVAYSRAILKNGERGGWVRVKMVRAQQWLRSGRAIEVTGR